MRTPLPASPPNMITILVDSAVKSHLQKVLKIYDQTSMRFYTFISLDICITDDIYIWCYQKQ